MTRPKNEQRGSEKRAYAYVASNPTSRRTPPTAEISYWLRVWGVIGPPVKKASIVVTAIASLGCTHVRPFAEVSFGYATDSGYYYTGDDNGQSTEIDESGCVNHTELGLEFDVPWYLPRELKAHHRSQCKRGLEVTANDAMLTWRVGGFRGAD